MEIRSALVTALADGAVHSGTDLAQRLACSRTAVWKHLNELKSAGLQINAQRGKGYQLRRPLELLDAAVIRRGLDVQVSAALGCLEVHDIIESTNQRLRASPAAAGRFDVVLAEYQTGGRGRRGRQWWSPFGSGLCLSVSHRFEQCAAAISALSLAIGVGVCRVLHEDVSSSVALKWPNDIVAGGSKLGGLLIDIHGEADGPLAVIVGIGLNFDVTAATVRQVADAGGLPPLGLRKIASGAVPSRNRLAARLVNTLHTVLTEFEHSGFDTFMDEWRRYDSLAGRPVTARVGERSLSGTARGIDVDGALFIEVDGKLNRLVSGEVSLRADGASKI